MVVNFKIDSNQKITVISFIRHLTGECDSAVVHAIRQYPYKLALPSAEYTIGFQFLLLDGGKPDSDIKPFDKSLYKNFLFEMNVTSEFPQRKPSIVY